VLNICIAAHPPLRSGAAVSTLFAFHVKKYLKLPVRQFAFGAPRIGDQSFADSYKRVMYPNSFRVTHRADVVPHVPGASLGFIHEGRQIYCGDAEGVKCTELDGEDDGGAVHISVQDHGVYMGVNFFDFLAIGDQTGCKAPPPVAAPAAVSSSSSQSSSSSA